MAHHFTCGEGEIWSNISKRLWLVKSIQWQTIQKNKKGFKKELQGKSVQTETIISRKNTDTFSKL